MGRVAGSYGVRGWLKVTPGAGVAQALATAKEWWIGAALYRVDEARVHGATVVAKLPTIETREQALVLKSLPVSLLRASLSEAEEGHYYLADLVGLEVVNIEGVPLGVVKRMFTNSAQDVMEVAGDGNTRLLPWVPAIVRKVDLQERRIHVDWQSDW